MTADDEGLVVWDHSAGNGAQNFRCKIAGDSAGYAALLCYAHCNPLPID